MELTKDEANLARYALNEMANRCQEAAIDRSGWKDQSVQGSLDAAKKNRNLASRFADISKKEAA